MLVIKLIGLCTLYYMMYSRNDTGIFIAMWCPLYDDIIIWHASIIDNLFCTYGQCYIVSIIFAPHDTNAFLWLLIYTLTFFSIVCWNNGYMCLYNFSYITSSQLMMLTVIYRTSSHYLIGLSDITNITPEKYYACISTVMNKTSKDWKQRYMA